VFMELSDIQPISRLERSQAYLDHPGGRFMFHLKSYTLKQLDIARKEVVDNWNNGRKAEALKKAVGLAIVWGAVGAGVDTMTDYLLGMKTKIEDKIFDTIARNLGWNDWASQQLMGTPGRAGNAAAAVGMTLAPPVVGFAYDIVTMRQQAIRHIPIIGRFLYAYGVGGALEQRERELIKQGGLPQVKIDRAAREEEGKATMRDKERVRMQKQKADADLEAARKRGDETKAEKLLERSEKLRGRLEKMGMNDTTGTNRPQPWEPYAAKLNQNAEPWTPPRGFFPDDKGVQLQRPVTIDPWTPGHIKRKKELSRRAM
jgi:hypothetical protein